MKIAKFIVECLVQLQSRNYALYTASNGKRIWTENLGYEPNDEVEIHYQKGAIRPNKIIINRIEKQTEQ
jgi:hypothetical protein